MDKFEINEPADPYPFLSLGAVAPLARREIREGKTL